MVADSLRVEHSTSESTSELIARRTTIWLRAYSMYVFEYKFGPMSDLPDDVVSCLEPERVVIHRTDDAVRCSAARSADKYYRVADRF